LSIINPENKGRLSRNWKIKWITIWFRRIQERIFWRGGFSLWVWLGVALRKSRR
jgi:hypothetical protein